MCAERRTFLIAHSYICFRFPGPMWKAHRQQSNWGEVHFSLEPSSGGWRSRNHSLHRGKTRDEQAQLGDCGRRMPHPIPCGYQTHQEQRIHIPSAGSKQIRPWCACWIRAHCCQKLLQWVLTLRQLASGSVMGSGDGVGRGQTVIEIVILCNSDRPFILIKI